jgi:chromosome segregation ATPase
VVAANVLAKESHIAELQAELAEPRDDYEQANWDCVRSTADHADAKGRLEQSRDRLRTASSRLSGLQRDLREHDRKLTALQAEAHRGEWNAPPQGRPRKLKALPC